MEKVDHNVAMEAVRQRLLKERMRTLGKEPPTIVPSPLKDPTKRGKAKPVSN
jgi:hypothetical protein